MLVIPQHRRSGDVAIPRNDGRRRPTRPYSRRLPAPPTSSSSSRTTATRHWPRIGGWSWPSSRRQAGDRG